MLIVSFEDMQKNLFVLQKMICNLEKTKNAQIPFAYVQ